MKKFKTGDIIYNAIKTYPKVKFFANSGSVYYNNDISSGGHAVLYNFLNLPPSGISYEDCFLITEDGNPILTENLQNLLQEQCIGDNITDTCVLLTENNEMIITEGLEKLSAEDC